MYEGIRLLNTDIKHFLLRCSYKPLTLDKRLMFHGLFLFRLRAWECDWVGTPVYFQRCVVFIIATADKEFTLTAGKFVSVSNKTMINVWLSTVHFPSKGN